MAAPTIPAANTQAVQSTGGGTIPFTQQWWAFFNSLISYVTTGPFGPVPIAGITTGAAAAAGIVGEYLSSLVAVSPGVSVNLDTATTITSLLLTPGDWDLWGEADVGKPTASGQVDYSVAALWTTPASVSPAATAYPSDGVAFNQLVQPADGDGPTLLLGPMVINITVSTTFYLSAFVDFSGGGTCPVGGAIRARRRR